MDSNYGSIEDGASRGSIRSQKSQKSQKLLSSLVSGKEALPSFELGKSNRSANIDG